MKYLTLIVCTLMLVINLAAQETDLPSSSKTSLGGYGQVDLNAPLEEGVYNNMNLDVHRIVLFLGHQFSDKVHFLTEIEFEHVKEVYIEQAYLDYRLHPALTFRGGLILIPMGIINIYHESATFHSVERPLIDHAIVPTTWREIGAGITGKWIEKGLGYELYLVNGFKSYEEGGLLGGPNGLRSGRQKGAESVMRSPNIAFRASYFGIPGLEAGLSFYGGKTQSTLYEGLKEDDPMISQADSSGVGLRMIGLDARYDVQAFHFRAQFYQTWLSNTAEYNAYTGNDLGQRMYGYYAEFAYDVLHTCQSASALMPFVRYSQFDTHLAVDGITDNEAYERQAFTSGLHFRPAPGASFKIGYQWVKNGLDDKRNTIQAGVAFAF